MDNMNTNEEIEIDLRELWRVVKRKIWLVAASGFLLALAAFLISKFILTPQYESTTKIYVLNKQDNSTAITYSDLQSGTQLTKDYMTLVTSRPVTEQVIKDLGLDMKHKDMAEIIKVSNPQDTRILSITVTYSDPFLAKKIADAVREAAAVHIKAVMNIEQVSIVEDANIPDEASSPNTMRNTLIGGVVGLFLAAGIVILIHILDDSIKTPDDIERYLGLSVLSSIPIQGSLKAVKKKAKHKKSYKNKENYSPSLNKL
ncbi:MAG: protein-tyrosine kinase [Anaerocolumna sp.]|jgi:capsular polysaccharide biosynthesis protein|nr:protein-tyrosine kinase [Anaerocolumna sp.]